MDVQDFRELKVWQKAHELVLAIYRETGGFPRDERFGLTSQLRRAGASVPANIAEGRCRATDRDFARFVGIALGSAAEVDYFLLLARDLGFIEPRRYKTLAQDTDEVKKMLSSLHSRLQADG